MASNYTALFKIRILNIFLRLFLGGMICYGGLQKFGGPTSEPTEIIEKVKAGKEVAPNTDILKIKNYVFGMKQSGFFWEFLGAMEFLAGILILSQVFSIAGAFIALPLTINIFLFHFYLERGEIGELLMTFSLVLINLWLIIYSYPKWKGILLDRTALQLKAAN